MMTKYGSRVSIFEKLNAPLRRNLKIRFIEKIAGKHGITTDEVEDILFGKSHFRRAQKGHIKGEDLYAAYGQTAGGRYLIVFFIRKEQTGRYLFQPVT